VRDARETIIEPRCRMCRSTYVLHPPSPVAHRLNCNFRAVPLSYLPVMNSNSRTMRIALTTVIFAVTCGLPATAQRELSGAAETRVALEKLTVTGSVMMIAAHPDDENTALLAYFARGRKVRTAYLSLTRGEGGQNLIGSDQGDALGLIRTQELLAARKIDGAEQFFTRAIDFGFTKTPQEAFDKWGREKILSDVVWIVRRFQPDVIVLRFSGTPRDGHGQHQASAILGREAFSAAADPHRFPEQLKWVKPWQAKRLMWNVFSFNRQQEQDAEKLKNRIEVDPGEYDPVLGYSYGEIAGMSRSMHKSQGMGAPQRKGSQKNYLTTVAGDTAMRDVFDGIDITWARVDGGAPVGAVLAEAGQKFDAEHPERIAGLLLKARAGMANLEGPIVERKRREIDEAIALITGLSLDATADKYEATPGGSFKVTRTVIDRGRLPVESNGKELPRNVAVASSETDNIAADALYSQPYWLREPKQGDTYTVNDQTLIGLPENPPLLNSAFRVKIDSQEIEYTRPVVYRYIDRVRGELERPLIVVPPVAVDVPAKAVVFPNGKSRQVDVELQATTAAVSGELKIDAPAGWTVEPKSRPFQIAEAGNQAVFSFNVTPPSGETTGALRASAISGGRTVDVGLDVIDYSHIPPQALFPPAATKIVRADIRLTAKNIGYIMGAGDDVPDALRQLGATVTLLTPDDLSRADLSRFDAIVTGVRAYNTRPDLRANEQRLLDYMQNGGTVVVQYNVLEGGPLGPSAGTVARIGPYPITISHDRVVNEDAPVKFLDPASPLLHAPNEITERDFQGWIQERGLYFATKWDAHYRPLFETEDAGEKPLEGATLVTHYGKGTYIFTALSFFRELPAGVPGAYRLFANFLSAGR